MAATNESLVVPGVTSPTLLQLNSSGDLSMYSYELGNSSSTAGGNIIPEQSADASGDKGNGQDGAAVSRQQPQQPHVQQTAGAVTTGQPGHSWLASLSLAAAGTAAAAAAAADSALPGAESSPDSEISDQDAFIEQDESLSAASSYAVNSCSRSLTMSSVITSPAAEWQRPAWAQPTQRKHAVMCH